MDCQNRFTMKKLILPVILIMLLNSCKKEVTDAPNNIFIGNYISVEPSNTQYIGSINISAGPNSSSIIITGIGQTALRAIVNGQCLTIERQKGDNILNDTACFVGGSGCFGYDATNGNALTITAHDSSTTDIITYSFWGKKQ